MRTDHDHDSEFRLESPPSPTSRRSTSAPTSGLLVTNHLNLMYMLAAGVIMPPSGFGGKYYADTLERVPGWVPLFLGKPFRSAVESSVSEAASLLSLIHI